MAEQPVGTPDNGGGIDEFELGEIVSLGDAQLDSARRRVLSAVLRCRECATHASGEMECARLRGVLKGAIAGFLRHCSDEEARMRAIAHPLLQPHQEAHRSLCGCLRAIALQLDGHSKTPELVLALEVAAVRLATHFRVADGLCAGTLSAGKLPAVA